MNTTCGKNLHNEQSIFNTLARTCPSESNLPKLWAADFYWVFAIRCPHPYGLTSVEFLRHRTWACTPSCLHQWHHITDELQCSPICLLMTWSYFAIVRSKVKQPAIGIGLHLRLDSHVTSQTQCGQMQGLDCSQKTHGGDLEKANRMLDLIKRHFRRLDQISFVKL